MREVRLGTGGASRLTFSLSGCTLGRDKAGEHERRFQRLACKGGSVPAEALMTQITAPRRCLKSS